MKKLLQGILIMSLFLCISEVKAESNDVFFTNRNNVSFTHFQYETLVDGLGLYPVLNMTQEDFDTMKAGFLNEEESVIEVYEDHNVVDEDPIGHVSTFSTSYHETAYKKLTGVTTCSSSDNSCLLTIMLEWKRNPGTRSRDVIGSLLHNSSYLEDSAVAVAFMNGSTTTIQAQRKTSVGRAAIIKLSSTGNINAITMSMNIRKSGTSQVSYQHAVTNVTLLTALSFDFSSAGMGGVFDYPDRYVGYYDDMAGVGVTNR